MNAILKRKISISIAATLVLLAIFVLTAKDSIKFQSHQTTGESRPSGSEKKQSINFDSRKKEKVVVTPPNDARIEQITDQLKALEYGRTQFCRQLENDSRVLYEYLVKAPSSEEIKEMKKLISQVDGITLDTNANAVSWKIQLTEDYVPSPEFEYLIVTVSHPKDGSRSNYSVMGVPTGKLDMRDGNAPISGDGKMHSIYSDVGFKSDSNWRYSLLFDEKISR